MPTPVRRHSCIARSSSGPTRAALLALLALVGGDAAASNFKITPVRVFLGPDQQTDLIEIRNDSDATISLQLSAVAWSQSADGRDVEQPTEDVIFFPKLFSLESGKAKKIRIGLVDPKPGATERTYRLYIQELASAKATSQPTVRVLLRMGVPIFLAPAQEKVAGALQHLKATNCTASFQVVNGGNVNLQLRQIELLVQDDKGNKVHRGESNGWYALAGATRSFELAIPAAACSLARKVKVNVDSDKLVMHGEAMLASGASSQP